MNNALRISSIALVLSAALCPGAAFSAEAAATPAAPAATEPPITPTGPKHADFRSEPFSRDARHIADWVVDSADNKGKPFVIVDKIAAKVFVFEPDGKLRGAAPALLGIAKGDHSAPGIGERELSAIRVQDRTTPSGRFVAALGENNKGKDILWVDYDSALSMHRVINTNPKEKRPHRLATPTPLDNRISFGCINVPIKFFDDVVSPSFKSTDGIVYVLPETRPVQAQFSSYDVDARAREKAARTPKEAAETSLRSESSDESAKPIGGAVRTTAVR